MKYLGDSFSVHPGASKKYRDNYDAIFGKKEEKQSSYTDELPEIPPPVDMKPEPVEEVKPKKKRKPRKKRQVEK